MKYLCSFAKKLFFVLLTLSLNQQISWANICDYGTVTLSSQAEVNAFPTTYAGCTNLFFSTLIIEGGDITDLSPLASISPNSFGMSIFRIQNNTILSNLTGLEKITYFDVFIIQNNPALTSLSDLSSVMDFSYANLEINNNDALLNTNGIPGTPYSSVRIKNNDQLQNIDGLSVSTLNILEIINNDALISLAGLAGLSTSGNTTISQNDMLPDLTGLNNLSIVESPFKIENNNALMSLKGLNKLRVTASSFTIKNNPQLVDISALEKLEVAFNFKITNNNSLSDCCILETLQADHSSTLIPTVSNNNIGCQNLPQVTTYCEDADDDGFNLIDGDCNDDPSSGGALIFPGAPELCDGIDNDCDNLIDIDDPDIVAGPEFLIFCKDASVQLGSNGNVAINPNDLFDYSCVATGMATLQGTSPASLDCGQIGENTVTLIAIAPDGSTATCTATVTVEDNTAPFIDCVGITVDLDANGQGVINAGELNDNNGSSDACGLMGFSFDAAGLESTLSVDCDDIGTFDDFVYVTDVNGNVSNPCSVSITVRDVTAPDAQCKDATIYLSDPILDAADLDNGSTDECVDANNLQLFMHGATGPLGQNIILDCSDVGTMDIILMVLDGTNSATCNSTVTVIDDIAPVAVCVDQTINISNGPEVLTPAALSAASTDNCGTIIPLGSPTTFDCDDIGVNVVTLTISDGTNTSTCTANVTVTDNTAPFIDCVGITVDLDANGQGVINASDLNDNNGSSDACGLLGFSFDEAGLETTLNVDCDDVGTFDDFVYVTDVNGNVSNPCFVSIIVRDVTAPDVQCKDVTVYLSNPILDAVDLDNGSTDECVAANNLQFFMYGDIGPLGQSIVLDCSDVGSMLISLLAADGTNSATCNSTVTVIDDIAPVAVCVDQTINISNGPEVLTPTVLSAGSSDNCGTIIPLASQTTFDCDDIGINVVTLTISDGTNTSTCTANVTVTDNTAPFIDCVGITVDLDANGQGVINANDLNDNNGSSDACGLLGFSFDEAGLETTLSVDCDDIGTFDDFVYVTDVNGNVSNPCSVSIIVRDVTAPDAQCKNISTQLDANGQASITASNLNNGSSDECSNLSFVLSVSSFDCDDVGFQTITMTITDESGNSASCTSTVAVEEIIPPVALCQNLTVTIDANELTRVVTPQEIDNGSNDACGISLMYLTQNSFSCGDEGANITTLKVTDAYGNLSDCTATVTVEVDDTLPEEWNSTDIGMQSLGNEYAYEPCGTTSGQYSVMGSGNNTMGIASDNVAFVHQSLCGDGTMIAKIEILDPNGYGGLMIRESVDPGAKQVSIFSNLTNILRHEARYTTNGMKQVNSFFKPYYTWLKLERQGDWVFAYSSFDGSNFQYVHGVYVSMQSCVEIGMASFTYLPNAQTEAVFSNVLVSGSNIGFAGNNENIESLFTVHSPSIVDHLSSTFKLYPNPANEKVNLQLQEPLGQITDFILYNNYGQEVKRGSIGSQNTHMVCDIEELPAGSYYFQLKGEHNIQITPLIISR